MAKKRIVSRIGGRADTRKHIGAPDILRRYDNLAIIFCTNNLAGGFNAGLMLIATEGSLYYISGSRMSVRPCVRAYLFVFRPQNAR